MRKTLLSLLTAVCCLCLTISVGFNASAYEKTIGTCPTIDVTDGLTADSVTVTDLNGNVVNVGVSGPESADVTYTKAAVIDGNESSWAGIAPIDANGNKILGWFILDLGKVYPVHGVTMVMQHDWEGVDVVIQLSENADFSDAITVYNNDADNSLGTGATYTADEKIPVKTYLHNFGNNGSSTDKNGNTFSFGCVSARYVRVTNNQFGDAALQNYSACGEINVYAYAGSENPNKTDETIPVMTNVLSGYYNENKTLVLKSAYENGEIFYTVNGSVPTDSSIKYTAPINLEVGKNYKIRATVKVNGVYAKPTEINVSLDEAGANVAQGKKVTLYSMDFSEELYAIDAGNNIADNKNMLVDGSFSADGCFRTATYDEATDTYTQCRGWAVVDLGKVYNINKIAYSMWNDWGFKQVVIQVSESGNFSADAITVYSNDDRKQVIDKGSFTLDESVSTHWELSNNGKVGSTRELNGNIWEFSSVKCRYIRVTNYTNNPECSYFTELQAFAAPTADEGEYDGKNLAAGLMPVLTSLDGSTELYAIDAGENIADDKAMMTDGSFSEDGCFRLATRSGETYAPAVGWATLDLGDVFYVDKIVYSMWKDWGFKRVVIQTALDQDFTDGVVTVYSNDDAGEVFPGFNKPFTLDDSIDKGWNLGNNGSGLIWEFASIPCRYVRVTNRTNSPDATYITELQVFGGNDTDYRNAAIASEITATSFDGSEKLAVRDNDNVKDMNPSIMADGSFEAFTNHVKLARNGSFTTGWVTVDFGGEYDIDKIIFATWHNVVSKDVIVQLSTTKNFTDGVTTIFSNDIDKSVINIDPISLDASINCNAEYLSNHTADRNTTDLNGVVFNFPSVRGRYLRVTNSHDGVTHITEIQAWGKKVVKTNYEYVDYIQSVSAKDELTLKTGFETDEVIAALNNAVKVTLADGTERSVKGSWTIDGYDKNKVAEYTATLIPDEKGDMFSLLDGLKIKISVVKYLLSVTAENKIYDGDRAIINISCSEDGYSVAYFQGTTELDSVPVDAGDYKVVVSIGEGDERVIKEALFTIEKADTQTISLNVIDKIYDGKIAEVTVDASADYTLSYYFGAEKLESAPVNAGTYEVVAEIAETKNVKGKRVVKSLTITKSSAVNLSVKIENKTYDGATVETVVTADGNYEIKYFAGDIELDGAPVNAGEYKIIVTVPETQNYFTKTVNKTFIIYKAQRVPEIKCDGKTYDGTPVGLTVTGETDYTVDWYDGETLLKSAPVDAGTYKAVVTVPQNGNYYAAIGENTVIITKADPQIEVTYVGEKLNENSQLPTERDFAVSGVKGTLTIKIALLKEGENVVEYTFTPEDRRNYNTITGTVRVDVEKTKSGCVGSVSASAYGAALAIAITLLAAGLKKKKQNR
ncbi:MAG: MBG domain-containing protein [Candidatus Borkfalkiaceae bacterium]|nr:MBG domain-containing protein [Christensenellaceae bacterium]